MKKELFLHFSNASPSANYSWLLLVAGVFFSSLLTTGLYAQTGVITGTVSDSTGPLRAVSVTVKGAATGTTTDGIGNYSIHASGNSVLVFSLVNYDKLSINVNNRSMVNIVMHANNSTLGEVVVIGYGTQAKANVTGAVSSIKGDALTLVPSSNLSNVLAGRLAGVFVSQSTGVPGVSSDIRVRSSSSWNSSPALMVIDGVVRDKAAFDALNANDIDNITVLKDGASASIYGARSSDGVILVTTKRGRKGRPVLTYNSTYMMQKPITKGATLLPAGRSAELNNLFSKAILGYDWFGQDEVDYLKAHGGYNYLDYAYVTPSTVDNALNISGGTDGVKYFIGGDVMRENGFLKALNFNKYNLRGSLDVSITDNLTASIQLSSTYSERQTVNFGGSDDLSAMYGKLSQFFFYVPPYIDGNLVNPGWIGNPIGLINNSGYVKSSRRGLDGLVSLNYNIPFVKGLSARVAYSRNDVNNGGKTYQIQHTLYNYKTNGSRQHIYTDTLLSISKAPYPGVPFLGVNNATQGSYQFNAQLSYQRDLGKHHIEATVLSEIFEEKDNADNLTRYSFPVITTDQFFATSADRASSDGNGSESTIGRSSYIGRVNYQYGDKYLLAASLRADGSMIFAPNHRWGYFPSVSAGWKISNEEFFRKSLGDMFNLVKLRASLGLTGNDAVAPWQWQESYTSAGNVFFGNGLQPVVAYGGVVNPNLTWEKSRSTNFGLDVVTKFNLSVSLDYWQRNTYDILGSRIVRMPTTFGGTLPAENYGKVNSRGFELELGYKGHAGAVDYSVNGNFAFATTKVIQRDFAPGGLAVDNPNGKPIGYTSGLISTGIIRKQSQLDALPAQYTIYGAKPVLGDLNYQDISGIGGKPDGKIDDYDRQIISNYSQGTAPYTAGLNLSVTWKGISLNAFFQSAFGYQKLYNDNWGRGFPLDASVNTWWGDMWTPDNPNGKIPRFAGPGEPNSGMASSFWYDQGGYIRLKNLSLGYDLPAKWLNGIKVQRVRLSVTGTNIFFISQFKWYDPEIGSLASYPNMKTLNFGLNVTL